MSVSNRSQYKVTFPAILVAVFLLHAFLFVFNGLPKLNLVFFKKNQRMVLNIRRVKTPKLDSNTLNNLPVREIKSSAPANGKMSFRDFAILQAEADKKMRPGARPEPITKKAITQISMQDKGFKDYAKSYPSGAADVSTLKVGAFKISDAMIGI